MKAVLQLASLAAASATSLRDVLTRRSDLTKFAELIDRFEAWQLFDERSEDITVMAPNDAAYDALRKIGLDLGSMPAAFTVPLLRYHLLEERIERARLPDDSDPFLVQTALTLPNMTQPSPVKLFSQAGEIYAESGLLLTAKVVEPDIEFSGGVVHVLNASLVAPHNISATLWMHGRSNGFLEFMEETDMVSELESLRDASLFVPSDEAWQEASSTLASMSMSEKRALLRNHAIEGLVVYGEDLGHRQNVATVGGQALSVRLENSGKIMVEDASVLRTDLLWFNGVAHFIDKVMTAEKVRL